MSSQNKCTDIYRLIQPIITKYSKLVNESYGSLGITLPQGEILILLKEKEILSIKEISEALGMVESNVSGICKRLEKLSLVTKVRQEEDQRVVKVILCQEAFPKIEEMLVIKNRVYSKLSDVMQKKDLDTVFDGFEKFNKLLDAFISEIDLSCKSKCNPFDTN